MPVMGFRIVVRIGSAISSLVAEDAHWLTAVVGLGIVVMVRSVV